MVRCKKGSGGTESFAECSEVDRPGNRAIPKDSRLSQNKSRCFPPPFRNRTRCGTAQAIRTTIACSLPAGNRNQPLPADRIANSGIAKREERRLQAAQMHAAFRRQIRVCAEICRLKPAD